MFASSAKPGHEPSQVTDTGSGCWIPREEENAWICLDLEGEKEITGVEAVFAGRTGEETVTVWVSSDGETYEPMTLAWKEPLYQRMETKKIRFVKLFWNREMQGVRFLRVWAGR